MFPVVRMANLDVMGSSVILSVPAVSMVNGMWTTYWHKLYCCSEYSVSFPANQTNESKQISLAMIYGIDDIVFKSCEKISILIKAFHIPMYLLQRINGVSVFHQQEVWVPYTYDWEMEFTLSQFQVCPQGRIQ